MKRLLISLTFSFFILFSISCIALNDGGKSVNSTSTLIVEPLSLTEHEKSLISKTGIEKIEYFTLNGGLADHDEVVLEVVTIENGKQDSFVVSTLHSNQLSDNEIYSFSIEEDFNNNMVSMITGIPGGWVEHNLSLKTDTSTFGSILSEKVMLEKDKPVYLAGWQGTIENGLAGLYVKEDGTLSDYLLKAEHALLLRVTLTNKKDAIE